jgi:two-component system OmpR family response regulator
LRFDQAVCFCIFLDVLSPLKDQYAWRLSSPLGRAFPRKADVEVRFMKVLVVEDDDENAVFIRDHLTNQGHTIDIAPDGAQGLRFSRAEEYDVIVLDRLLPDGDGIELVKQLRHDRKETPVLFLTNLSGIDDRVHGLEAGGDDYLVKPFALSEFMARLLALARRASVKERSTVLSAGGVEMDLIKRTVRRQGKEIELQPREFQLLEYLMRNEGRVVTRTMLLENVWDFHFDPNTNIVETHISRLRAKVDRGHANELIQTIRGVGYCFRVSS